MEDKKESCSSFWHFKLWLFAIIVTLIFLFGRVTAHAAEMEFQFDTAVGMYSYYFVAYDVRTEDYRMYTSTKPFWVNETSVYAQGECSFNSFVSEDGINWNGQQYAYDNLVEGEKDNVCDRSYLVYSSHDICDEDGNVFFSVMQQIMTVQVPRVQRKVMANLEVILPTAVFCLALLMGLAILRKKLPAFLH